MQRGLHLILLLLLLAACGGSDGAQPTATQEPEPANTPTLPASTATPSPPPATATSTATLPPTATPTTTATAPVVATATAAPLPATPVGDQLAWVIDELLNQPEAQAPEAVAERLSDAFLAQVPATDLLRIAADFRRSYGVTRFVGFVTTPTETEAIARVTTGSGARFMISISVETLAPHRITGLFISPDQGAQPTPTPAASWADIDSRLAERADWVNFLVAEVVDGSCVPLHDLDAARPLALGSAFKLYVLGTLAQQVAQGTHTWDEELAVRDDWKSLPSGVMQNEPAGTTHTLRYFAERMISISDNTATDHLLFHLGREQVEAMQAQMGHSAPHLNQPFLSTREMFVIKLVLSEDERARYVAADSSERRRILDEEISQLRVSEADATAWVTPRDIDTIEWFASAEDLCRAMATLHRMAGEPGLEPVLDILALNPGVQFDPQAWTYIGFKGGSEPGVLNLTWLLGRADGRWFVMTVGLNDPQTDIDANAVVALMQSAAGLLARE